MSGIRNFHVRKYSFQKDGQWQHFPPRNGIALTVINTATVKVIWKSSVMEEIQLHASTVDAYTKSPAIGFKYYAPGDAVHKRFQVSFTSPQEHLQCLSYLRNECDLSVRDTSVSALSSTALPQGVIVPQMTQMSQAQIPAFTDSQFAIPITPQLYSQSAVMVPPPTQQQQQQQQQQSHYRSYTPVQSFFPSQPSVSQPSLSQPQVALPHLSMTQYTQPETHIDYLSQILDPQKDDEVIQTNITLDHLDQMTDQEIKELLKEKIKDVGFINFVERLESCLKGMQ